MMNDKRGEKTVQGLPFYVQPSHRDRARGHQMFEGMRNEMVC